MNETARAVGQVEQETISVADEVSVLEELVAVLEDRLRPITVAVPENSIEASEAPEPDRVPLASMLATQRRRIGRLTHKVRSITSRLEL